MNKLWDVLGFGAVTVDDLFYVAQYPAPDSKVPVLAKRREGGGLTGTALVAASRLGASTAYCGVLGGDELSRFTLDQLIADGVDCTCVLRDEEARPRHSAIIVDQSTGQRTILSSAEGLKDYPCAAISDDLINQCRVVFVDHTAVEAGCRAAELAHQQGIPVVADIERTNNAGILELMARADHLIINLQLGRELTGESETERILQHPILRGRTCCVLTDGARGCWFSEHNEPVSHVPAFEVASVDTTGCGDVFHGAYAACIARGDSISTATLIATAAAGLKATKPGGRSGIPTLAEVQIFLSIMSASDGRELHSAAR